MKKLLSFLMLTSILFACGDAGIQFNLSTELPIDAPFNIDIPTAPDELIDLLDVNPPSETLEYSLSGVDAFSDDLDNLGDVTLNAIYYEIEGIEGAEQQIDLDEFSITLIAGATNLPLVSQTNQLLNNVTKTEIPLTPQEKTDLVNHLTSGGAIGANILFDLASIPSGLTNLSINYRMYFDVTINVQP